LAQAEAIVNARSPYADREEWAVTKRHHALWAEPIIYAMQGLPEGSRVLDIGPGYGALAVAATLLGHEVLAMELFLRRIAWPQVHWWHGNVCRIDDMAGWGAFDFAIMAEVLEHLTTDPSEALDNIATALKPGAAFLGSTPTPGVWPGNEPTSGDLPKWTPEHVAEDRHVRLYSQDETRVLLENAGFEVLYFEPLGDPAYRYLWRAQKAVAA
jgi:2-polyprenyl-3-methyl-5-hydroxy-6-metoxy-1,4-benzoquinol methylase